MFFNSFIDFLFFCDIIILRTQSMIVYVDIIDPQLQSNKLRAEIIISAFFFCIDLYEFDVIDSNGALSIFTILLSLIRHKAPHISSENELSENTSTFYFVYQRRHAPLNHQTVLPSYRQFHFITSLKMTCFLPHLLTF